MINPQRLTATMEGNFVVFMMGMPINRPWMVHKRLPLVSAMPLMLDELYRQPESGFVYAEMWFSRTTVMVQYWRSMHALLAYATDREAQHLPAWQAFNRAVGVDGTVGIWHETYAAKQGSCENVDVNMPAFGLGKAGDLVQATGARTSARGRLSAAPPPASP